MFSTVSQLLSNRMASIYLEDIYSMSNLRNATA